MKKQENLPNHERNLVVLIKTKKIRRLLRNPKNWHEDVHVITQTTGVSHFCSAVGEQLTFSRTVLRECPFDTIAAYLSNTVHGVRALQKAKSFIISWIASMFDFLWLHAFSHQVFRRNFYLKREEVFTQITYPLFSTIKYLIFEYQNVNGIYQYRHIVFKNDKSYLLRVSMFDSPLTLHALFSDEVFNNKGEQEYK